MENNICVNHVLIVVSCDCDVWYECKICGVII